MNNTSEWQMYRKAVKQVTGNRAMQRKQNIIFVKQPSKKKSAIRGFVTLLGIAVVAMIGLMYYSEMAVSAPSVTVINHQAAAAPAGNGMNIGAYADYIFVIALPFAVLLMFNQFSMLRQLRDHFRK